jgi:hypothetical protein
MEKAMRSLVSLFALVTVFGAVQSASSQEAAAAAVKGSMLVAADGARLAPVYRVGPDGSPQIIIDGKLRTIPAATVSTTGGKLVTSLTKNEVLALR